MRSNGVPADSFGDMTVAMDRTPKRCLSTRLEVAVVFVVLLLLAFSAVRTLSARGATQLRCAGRAIAAPAATCTVPAPAPGAAAPHLVFERDVPASIPER